MWIYTEPEKLRNYPSRPSLEKALQSQLRYYQSYSHQRLGNLTPWLAKTLPQFHDNLWYTGISSNPLLSLAAHGVDIRQPSRFLCWVIPAKYAKELKQQGLTIDFFQHIWQDESDYLAPEQPYTYLYHFLVEQDHQLLIDTAGFTPLNYVPTRPAQIFAWKQDGSRHYQEVDSQQQDDYPVIVADLLRQAQAGQLTCLLLRHPQGKLMQWDWKPEGYDLFFDNRTSQSGYVYKYLCQPGQVDWASLQTILLHFLQKGAKPRGSKWRYLKHQMVSDNMRFVNGMIAT